MAEDSQAGPPRESRAGKPTGAWPAVATLAAGLAAWFLVFLWSLR